MNGAEPESPETARIREQIEQTRAQVSGTIEELQDRLRPQHLVHQAGEAVREAVTSRVQSVVDTAADTGRRVASKTRTSARQLSTQVQERPGVAVGAMAGLAGLAWVLAMRGRGGAETWDDASTSWQDQEADVDDTASSWSGESWRATSSGWPDAGNDDDEPLWGEDHPIVQVLPSLLAGAAGYYAVSQLAQRYPDAWPDVRRRVQAALPPRVSDTVRSGASTVGSSVRSLGHKAGDTASTIGEKASELGQQARAAAASAAGQVKDRLRRVGGAARQQAQQGSAIMSDRTERLGQTAGQWMDQNPLMLGVAAFALGALAGMSMPQPPVAQRALGKARSTLMDAAGRAVDKVAG